MGIADILRALANGAYDGERTGSEIHGVSSGYYIENGTPVKYRQGKSTRFFDGKENIRTPGKRTEDRFKTDEEKTIFFQKYGYLREMFGKHPEVIDYSRAYYEAKKNE
ncbi:hypothetical protein [Cryobacterium sp. Y29]|uniref:hypothetical protein n=1 Tax=Cryobacterium sp. Y29 TaxID=2048285 RepID=UPI000CE33509|nr:hypothetical protein [Cryobacterium sp. Y29]